MPESQSNKMKWIERVAYLLDEQFRFPGTKFRFGLDPLMNLIPFVGDLSGFMLSAVLVMTMARNGASGLLLVRMSFNILLDATIGAIPVLGQIFDFYYKANKRNVQLLKEHYTEGKHQGSGKKLVFIILIGFLVIVAAIIYLMWKALGYVGSLF
jgi:hypothetical protein